jgi:uncharacterized SAM-dependent methyltransferase
MNDGDRLFVGFDLQKDPRVILRAYDDASGVTAEFNLNLLTRINRELGADFNLSDFSHYASYHPIEGAARSFLISRKTQTVSIKALNESFEFAAWEPIFMEISQKYNPAMIEDLARTSGFQIAENFFDRQKLLRRFALETHLMERQHLLATACQQNAGVLSNEIHNSAFRFRWLDQYLKP